MAGGQIYITHRVVTLCLFRLCITWGSAQVDYCCVSDPLVRDLSRTSWPTTFSPMVHHCDVAWCDGSGLGLFGVDAPHARTSGLLLCSCCGGGVMCDVCLPPPPSVDRHCPNPLTPSIPPTAVLIQGCAGMYVTWLSWVGCLRRE